MIDFVKKPCKHCPFRRDVVPYLHPLRAEEIAYSTENPYNDFPCHKTTEPDDYDESEMMITENSKTCAGFITMQAQAGEPTPNGFEPAWDLIYQDPYEMIEAYEIQWNLKSNKL